jgi:hypothetical protein
MTDLLSYWRHSKTQRDINNIFKVPVLLHTLIKKIEIWKHIVMIFFLLFSLDERGAGRTRHSGGSRSAGGGKRKDTDANS